MLAATLGEPVLLVFELPATLFELPATLSALAVALSALAAIFLFQFRT